MQYQFKCLNNLFQYFISLHSVLDRSPLSTGMQNYLHDDQPTSLLHYKPECCVQLILTLLPNFFTLLEMNTHFFVQSFRGFKQQWNALPKPVVQSFDWGQGGWVTGTAVPGADIKQWLLLAAACSHSQTRSCHLYFVPPPSCILTLLTKTCTISLPPPDIESNTDMQNHSCVWHYY